MCVAIDPRPSPRSAAFTARSSPWSRATSKRRRKVGIVQCLLPHARGNCAPRCMSGAHKIGLDGAIPLVCCLRRVTYAPVACAPSVPPWASLGASHPVMRGSPKSCLRCLLSVSKALWICFGDYGASRMSSQACPTLCELFELPYTWLGASQPAMRVGRSRVHVGLLYCPCVDLRGTKIINKNSCVCFRMGLTGPLRGDMYRMTLCDQDVLP